MMVFHAGTGTLMDMNECVVFDVEDFLREYKGTLDLTQDEIDEAMDNLANGEPEALAAVTNVSKN